MPNDTTQPDNSNPDADTADSANTGGTQDPHRRRRSQPGPGRHRKAQSRGSWRSRGTAEDPQNLDLTPEGLSDEPAKQEDPDSLAKPENS